MQRLVIALCLGAIALTARAEGPGDPEPRTASAPETEESRPGASESPESSTQANSATATLLGPAEGLQVFISPQLQVGTQPEAALQSVQASIAITANYRLSKKFILVGSISPWVELTPMPNDNMRADVSGASIRLNMRDLYTEKFSGISLGASVAYALPINYAAFIGGNPSLGGGSAAVQLFRPFDFGLVLVGSVSANMPFFLKGAATPVCINPEGGATCPTYANERVANTLVTLSTGLTAIYSYEDWSFFSSLGISERYSRHKYVPDSGPGTNTKGNSFSFVAQASYQLFPFLTLNAGWSNAGPQINGIGGAGYNNPFFEKEFASVFFGVDYIP